MTPEHLDEFLRQENDYEKDPSATFNLTAFNEILLHMTSFPYIEDSKAFTEHMIISADGVIASKQDRHHAVLPHAHNWMELAYMYSGHADLTIAGQKISLVQGQCILINYNVSHSCAPCGHDDILINLLLSRNYLQTNFFNRFSDSGSLAHYLIASLNNENRENGYIHFKSADNRRLSVFMREFLCEYYDKSIHYNDYLDSLTTLIFLELSDIYKDESIRDASEHNEILSILRYIEGNYRNCTLKSTAEFFHMNPNYLSSYIHKHTGKTFKSLIQEQRMMLATRLLSNSDLSVTDIALQAGYENITFFYKKFRQLHGCSPAEYRKQFQ